MHFYLAKKGAPPGPNFKCILLGRKRVFSMHSVWKVHTGRLLNPEKYALFYCQVKRLYLVEIMCSARNVTEGAPPGPDFKCILLGEKHGFSMHSVLKVHTGRLLNPEKYALFYCQVKRLYLVEIMCSARNVTEGAPPGPDFKCILLGEKHGFSMHSVLKVHTGRLLNPEKYALFYCQVKRLYLVEIMCSARNVTEGAPPGKI